MKPFRDQPIQRKMLLMTLLISGAVLFVATAALFTFQILNFRFNAQRDTATLAAIIANNSTAALAFNDTKAADEVVQSLKANPTIVWACLTTVTGKFLAQFGEDDYAHALAEFPQPGTFRYARGHLLYTQTVELDGRPIGALYLRADYQKTFLRLLGFYALVILVVMITSVSLAVFLSGRLRRFITNPILQLAETAGIVGARNDYSVRAPASRSRDELGRLTESFNNMLGRIQAQDAALNLSQQKMESLIHSIDGIVWEWNPQESKFTFVSPQSQRLLGYPPERWVDTPGFWEQIVHPEDWDRTAKVRRDATGRRQPYSQEYRMVAADQRLVWIRESGVLELANDQVAAFRGILIDITEQRNAADNLARLNEQIAKTQRQAGMAEVATGVLHNVGNVLNSVNVAAALLRENVGKSQIQNLVKATHLLRDHAGDTAAFLTQDAKGQRLPGYLIKLGAHLATEQLSWQQELDGLNKNVEHIKEIVAMQQNYARLSGVTEALNARELLEDALRMNLAALTRHGVQIVRDFTPTPLVAVDKHKVLQILINLIRNAKHAMAASNKTEKTLTVTIRPTDHNAVHIQVQDNGTGIAPENLVRVFQHGFTTKKEGHGFGLHSGANAAREMGGNLTVHSAGPETGATFTLELPIATPNSCPVAQEFLLTATPGA